MIRRLIRTALTYVPFSQEMKSNAQRIVTRMAKVPFEQEFKVLRLLPEIKGALFVDVGGNQGFAIDAISMYCRGAKIISFEPHEYLAAKLRATFVDNANVEILQLGLGDVTGEFATYTPVYRGFIFWGLTSLIKEMAVLTERDIAFFDSSRLTVLESRCQVKRLDDFNLNPFFLKIDAQGSEMAILRGAWKTISESRPIILMESVTDEHIDYLRPLGYALFKYDSVTGNLTTEGKGTVNSFLVTDDKMSLLKLRSLSRPS